MKLKTIIVVSPITRGMDVISQSEEQELVAQRAEYLQVMLEDSYRKTDLTDVLDAPRSTVDRAVRQLEEAGLVKRVDSEFTVTLAGELAFRRYKDYVEFSDNIFAAKEILNAIEDDVDLPFSLFYDAEVVQAESHLPERPVLDVRELVEESPYLHGSAPVAMSMFTEVIQELLMEGGHSFEIVASEQVFETLQTAMGGEFEVIQEHAEQFQLYVTEEDLPYALWFVEPEGVEHVGLTVYGEMGAVGTLVSRNEDAVAWGREEYERYKSESEQIL